MKKKKQTDFYIEAASHPGMTGKKNEDRYRVKSYLAGKNKIPALIAVLCDGIGGHRAGEVAAEMAASIITDIITNSDPKQPLEVISKAVMNASDAIYKASQTDQGRSGMGTTCACAWLIGERLYTGSLGDSRIYLCREGHLIQLTTDHTWVQEAIDAGVITEKHKENHPNAHVIRRYLGSKKPPEPDFRLWYFEGEGDDEALNNQGMKIEPGDVLLLCSDGLTDLVSDQEILEIIQTHSLSKAPNALIGSANNRGGHDNTTVILIKSPDEDQEKSNTGRKRRWLAGCLGIMILVSALITTILLGIGYFKGRLLNDETPTPRITQNLPAGEGEEIDLLPSPSLTPSPTSTMPSTPSLIAPANTITPWPTHTLEP